MQNQEPCWSIEFQPWAHTKVLKHTGSNNFSYADVWIVPSQGWAIMVATNAGGEMSYKACNEICSLMARESFRQP